MKKRELVGWILFTLLALSFAIPLVLFILLISYSPENLIEDANSETSLKMEEIIVELQDELAEAKKANESLVAQLEEARERISELESEEQRARPTAGQEPTTEDTESTEVNEEEEDAPPTLEEIRERIRGNEGVRAQMRAVAGLVYADLLNGLELETAAKETLRELLIDSQMEEVALQAYASRAGDVTGRQYGEWIANERARVSAEIRELLSDEDYAAWEAYQATVDERALDVTFENQLRAFSSGLTPENRDLVIAVGVEEFIAEQDAIYQSDEVYTAQDPYTYQIRAMDRMRERLQPVMEEEQYGEVVNWLDMGERLMNQAIENASEDGDDE